MREIYRLLEAGEEKLPTDEYMYINSPRIEWRSVSHDNGENFSEQQFSGFIYRRRETIEDEPKWKEVKNRAAMTIYSFPAVSRHEDGSFHLLYKGTIQDHRATHYLIMPPFPQESVDFETFWQTNKAKLLDIGKDSVKLIYEEARKL